MPLVLHVGFSGSIAAWYRNGYVEALHQDYRLILLDPRGQGHSDTPHEPEAYAPPQRVADVLAVLNDLGIERAHYLGYSMGGRIGFDLGLQAPDRFLSLAIGGAHPSGSDPDTSAQEAETFRGGMPAYVAAFERQWGMPAELRAELLASDGDALAAALLAHRPSLEAELPALRLPALIYCGDQDMAHDPAQRAAALLPAATFVSLPGLNHMQGMQRSDLVLPHITSFLQRRGEGTRASAAPA